MIYSAIEKVTQDQYGTHEKIYNGQLNGKWFTVYNVYYQAQRRKTDKCSIIVKFKENDKIVCFGYKMYVHIELFKSNLKDSKTYNEKDTQVYNKMKKMLWADIKTHLGGN